MSLKSSGPGEERARGLETPFLEEKTISHPNPKERFSLYTPNSILPPTSPCFYGPQLRQRGGMSLLRVHTTSRIAQHSKS